MIRLEHISKIYDTSEARRVVLQDINLSVHTGEFIAIMGPSGSGKSTLLNIIGGLERPTTGEYSFEEIAIHQQSMENLNKFRASKIGFVFQNYSLVDDINIYQNIELALIAQNKKRKDRKKEVERILEVLELKEHEKKLPNKLSGGEQQRCAIARAVVGERKVILADEPTGSLDKKMGIKIMELLKQLNQKEGKTVIMVTHDSYIASFADRIIYLQDGVIMDGERV